MKWPWRVILATAVALAPAEAQREQRVCGVERWPVKVGVDSDVLRLDTLPFPSSVTELGDLPRPEGDLPNDRRLGPNELRIFRIRAVLRRLLFEGDGDIHLVLEDTEDSARTMVAEIPDSSCARGSRYAAAFAVARRALQGAPLGTIVEVDGLGFFDFPHGQLGVAPNTFELHPVIAFKVITPPQRQFRLGGAAQRGTIQ